MTTIGEPVKETKTLSQSTGELVGLCALIAICMAWRGFIVTKLWGWFVVAHFGARPLPLATAVGLSLLAGMFTVTTRGSKDDREGITFDDIVRALGYPAVVLLIGWAVVAAGGQ